MNWFQNRRGGLALAAGWLVLTLLTACESPKIPGKHVAPAADMSSKPELLPTPDQAPDKDRGDAPDKSDHEDRNSDRDAGEPEPEPDAGPDGRGDPNSGVAGAGNAGTGGAGGTGGGANAEPIGFWTGHVVDILGPMFDLCMQITQVGVPGLAGMTSYSNGVTCGGELTYIEMMRDTYSFGERIVRGGPCIPAGRIDMRLNSDGTLDWEWFRTGTDVPQETSTMQRVDRCPQ